MSEAIAAGSMPIAVQVTAGETYWWCVCGRSNSQPFCDGSHQATSIEPLEWLATETRRVLLCTCKRTRTAPLCDGSHLAAADDAKT